MSARQFYMLCKDGLLSEAKDLLRDNPDIDITAFDNMAFRAMCYICKSLYFKLICGDDNMSSHYHNYYKYFYSKRYNKYLEIAQWLESLKPNLYKIIYDDDGSYKDYFIDYKEILWQKRKYPVWLASDQTPCKKNLFYKMPQDVSRYIIQKFL